MTKITFHRNLKHTVKRLGLIILSGMNSNIKNKN